MLYAYLAWRTIVKFAMVSSHRNSGYVLIRIIHEIIQGSLLKKNIYQMILPGHGLVLHIWASPSCVPLRPCPPVNKHSKPPYAAAGLLHVRVLC